MANEEKSSGRQGSDPNPERDVRVKGEKTSREMPDEDLRRGGVVESKSGKERIDSLENIDSDVKDVDGFEGSDEDQPAQQASRGDSQSTGRGGYKGQGGGSQGHSVQPHGQEQKPGERQNPGSQQGQPKSKP